MAALAAVLAFLCFSARAGIAELAHLTITAHLAVTTQVADAELPAGTSLNWQKTKILTLNAKRAQVSLDGIWKFIPAEQGVAEPPKAGWAYIKVPGSWQNSRGRSADFAARGGGPQWDLYDGTQVSRAWYERRMTIPAQWQGKAIRLRFERVSTDAIVYVNGIECGRVSWPWGEVDITSAVTPGQVTDVRLLVAAIADAEEVGTFWQNALSSTVTFSKASLQSRGLTGSVFLESHSPGARVSDVFVRTSTRKKEIALDIDLAGVTQAGPAQIVAEMLNEKGEVETTFTGDTRAEAKTNQTLVLSWPWDNPRLWDVGQPNLYTLRLKVKGSDIDDEYQQKFGFREFWIEGRQFYLNGTVIRLRQPCFYNGPRGQVGDIFSEMGSENIDTRGDMGDSGRSLDEADRGGYLVAQYILNANKFMMAPRGRMVWEQNRDRAFERADVWMRHYRNHPSIVMWIAGFNFFNNAVDADPRHIGRHGWGQEEERWKRLMNAGNEVFEGLRKLDRSRAFYSHAGAYTGDIYTMNCYLDLIPLQEREDWLSAWAESGEMPLSMVEFGTPMDCTFRRARHGFESNITSEPLLTEFAAIYFGSESYTSEEPKYREFLHSLFRSGMLYQSSENRLDEYANNHKLQQLYRINTWRTWRTAGLPGGLRTWSWMQDALKEVNGPTLAWIAGGPEGYTAKDHHFFTGQRIEKQLVLINDTRRPQPFTAAWNATISGQKPDAGEVQGTLAVSEIKSIPFTVIPRAVPSGDKADGRITFTATIGDATHKDTFTFHVFGEDKQSRGSVLVYDPEDLTVRMLAFLGYRTRPLRLSNTTILPSKAPLVVIGRNALKDDTAVLADLESYVRSGGRVLIFAQEPDLLTRAFGWRVCPKVTRRVFPIRSSVSNASFSKLDSDDLRDWSGSSSLIAAYPQYVGDYLRGNEREQPYAGWHWGNRGGVTSAAIEKPHRSGWRPLLECEFDLAYTPLMELDYGKGRVLVCTLDLEDHVGQDPAARRIVGEILHYALTAPATPRVESTVYLGGPSGAVWLDKTGVSYRPSEVLASSTDLLIVGPDANISTNALKAYLEKGGRVFFLPQSRQNGWLGVTLKPAADHFAGSRSVPEWPQLRGLSASDLRWRCYLDSPSWILSEGAEIGADGLLGRRKIGKGTAIFCQVDPESFHADEKTYFRYTRWRATHAVSQLLANLGASFKSDANLFHPFAGPPNIAAKWFVGVNGDRSGPQATGPGPRNDSDSSPGSQLFEQYCPDYRTDFPMGDNPYRYYRW